MTVTNLSDMAAVGKGSTGRLYELAAMHQALWGLAGEWPRDLSPSDFHPWPETKVCCGSCGNILFEVWARKPRNRAHVRTEWMTDRELSIQCGSRRCAGGVVTIDAAHLVADLAADSPWRDGRPSKVIVGEGAEADRYPDLVWRPSKPAASPAPTAP